MQFSLLTYSTGRVNLPSNTVKVTNMLLYLGISQDVTDLQN